jgi:LysM repeat protein
MTRETKIGLLVGLAFVIVIGILISDHLSSTNEPGGAPLRAAAENVRASLGQTGDTDVAPPLRAPTSISPQQTVVTSDELNRRSAQPPVVFVTPPVIPPVTPPVAPQQPVVNRGNQTDHLHQIARNMGEEIVVPPGNDSDNTPPPRVAQPAPPAAKARTYEAQPGDSLGGIALKEMGSSCKANRDAIIAANPGLADNRDLIVAGRRYVIPAINNGTVTATMPPHTTEPAKPTEATVTYTVKSHDTLWSIATTEVGSPNAVAAIKELNQDVLNGSDRVRPNMKLKLPARLTVTRTDE